MTPTVDYTIYTDASDQGWGATFNGTETGGRWSQAEQKWHINVKELLVVEFGLKALFHNYKGGHVRIMTDNTTTVAYVRKMGGCKFYPVIWWPRESGSGLYREAYGYQ